MHHVVILVQARMSSKRLPGKVTRPLAGQPSILRMMARVAQVSLADERWLVTSQDPSDDELFRLTQAAGINCFRGSLEDVLGRFVAACPRSADTVVRLTGDCPLIDPGLVDAVIREHLAAQPNVDYSSNAVERTQPDGLDVEVFSRSILERAAREATLTSDREHVTPWIIRAGRKRAHRQRVDLSALRWTLDTEADYQNIAAIYEALHPMKPHFDRFDVYRLLVSEPSLIRVAGRDTLSPDEIEFWRGQITEHLEDET